MPGQSVIKIFISYSHEDKAVAEKLAKMLERHGCEVWWDTFLIADQDYRERIANQLETADKVIVLWSSHSVRSPFVIDEAQRANKRGKLIPIVIDVSDPPMGFGHLHTVLAKDIAAEFERIIAAIQDRTPISAGKVARTISRQRRRHDAKAFQDRVNRTDTPAVCDSNVGRTRAKTDN